MRDTYTHLKLQRRGGEMQLLYTGREEEEWQAAPHGPTTAGRKLPTYAAFDVGMEILSFRLFSKR